MARRINNLDELRKFEEYLIINPDTSEEMSAVYLGKNNHYLRFYLPDYTKVRIPVKKDANAPRGTRINTITKNDLPTGVRIDLAPTHLIFENQKLKPEYVILK